MRRQRTLLAIFALSGFSGLIYESIWTHYLKLVLGHAAYAQSLVLAIFMGGMALGSWLSSRFSGRWPNLLRAYALSELAIGLLAFAFHPVFVWLTDLSLTVVAPRLPGPAAVEAFEWALSAALILPQSILLGMTFPLMSAGLIRTAPDRPGRWLALLYFANSLGAAIGAMVSGFLLIRWVGLPGTVAFAGAVNVALAGIVWWMFRDAAAQGTGPLAATPAPRGNDRTRALVLVAALVTGASSFMYEIGWIRMLALVLGASTQAFELMLAAFILGLALGGLWIQGRIDRLAEPVRALAFVQVAMGLLALATLPLYGQTFGVMRWLVGALPRTDAGYLAFNVASGGISMAVMLPASVCAGMTLPLATVTLLRRGHGERSIGQVYAANTVGAILGVFASLHFGLPVLGLKGLLVLGASLDIGLGIVLFFRAGWRGPLAVASGAMGVAAVAAALSLVTLDPYLMDSGVYREGKILSEGENRILFHRDGKTATVSLVQEGARQISLRTNGKADATVSTTARAGGDEATQVLLGAIPLALVPGARTAAVIGLGSGVTTATLLASPLLASVDTIEIEEQMIAAAALLRPRNERAFQDPRSRIYVEDAKTFFSAYQRRYDLVISEPSNPWVSGVAGLFSVEFYGLVKRHLRPGGVLAQWVQLYETDVELVVSALKAIDETFADYAVFATQDYDMLIVASDGPVGELRDHVFGFPELAAAMSRVDVRTLQDLELRRVGTRAGLHGFVRSHSIPANSDYWPVLDQNATRARFLDEFATALVDVARRPLPVGSLLARGKGGWPVTAVTRSEHFRSTGAVRRAMAVRDYLTGDGSGFPRELAEFPPETMRVVAGLRLRLRQCAAPPPEAVGLDEAFGLLVDLLPSLSGEEVEAILRPLQSPACSAALAPAEAECLALVLAVGRRDGPGLARSARRLLASPVHLTTEGRKVLVASGMLGSLMQGDPGAASLLWRANEPMITAAGDAGLQLQLLVAESMQDGTRGRR